ncbi:MAG: polysaccharide biosynthesis protein [Planctomycetaceae bacterium]|jgi:FlaA1/EpsC-like NDP-sugar epimerase|nr:polysaccharide biosynthesis protein [Planctomycetaceae bacterium]
MTSPHDATRFDTPHHSIQPFGLWLNTKKFIQNRYFLFFFHAILFILTYYFAFTLRFDLNFYHTVPETTTHFLDMIFWVVSIKLAIFYIRGHFRDIWFYATVRNLKQLIITSCIAMMLIYAAQTLIFRSVTLPRSIPVLDAILTIMILGSLRLATRMIHEDFRPRLSERHLKKTLLLGANYEGVKLASVIHSYPEIGYKIVGFITIHREKVRSILGQIPILGHFDDLVTIAAQKHVTEILVIAGVLNGSKMRTLIDQCQQANLNLRVIPQIETRLGNRKIPIRDINIDDLLKRDPIHLDNAVIRELIAGRRVLVTGAGGSIGSEICRQILRFQPESLLILGRGENRIFFLERELSQIINSATRIVPVIANITDEDRMNAVFEEFRPEVVFHAAAHKHVPLMEINISEAIRNNIYGTKIVSDLADEYGVKTFVLISTDKAVNPTSVMGTSKQMAERYVHAMSQKSTTQFIITRFGNVLGSAGSVVPIFKEQIQNGGPITITDERMTRFFMTIPEAAQLVLQAAAMGEGGEIFVLDMGEPVKIVELARDMIRLAGLPENAIEIKETGLRPGEKLYEELYFDSETTIETQHPKLRAAFHRPFGPKEVKSQILELCGMLDASNEELRAKLREFVPEYKPFQEQQKPNVLAAKI